MANPSTNLNHCLMLTFILSMFLISCSKIDQEDVVDRSFVTGSPCAAPCWYGLELDKSNYSDVVSTLKSLPFVDKSSIQEHSTIGYKDDKAIEIGYDCVRSRKYCGGLLLSGDKLKRVFNVVNFPLTFKEVVDKLKEPDSLDYGVCQPERPACGVVLNWQNLEISVMAYGKDLNLCKDLQSGGNIPPETEVTEISYITKEAYLTYDDSCLKRIPWIGFSQNK